MRPIHLVLVDAARLDDDPRPVCGTWGDDVTWTTLPVATTCAACVRWLLATSEPMGLVSTTKRGEDRAH